MNSWDQWSTSQGGKWKFQGWGGAVRQASKGPRWRKTGERKEWRRGGEGERAAVRYNEIEDESRDVREEEREEKERRREERQLQKHFERTGER
eukprot:764222-Hanusia_phi.AAC.1